VLTVGLQLQPPPQRCGGRGLRHVQEGAPALPGPVHPDTQIDFPGQWTGEGLAGLFSQPVCDRGGHGPCQHRQPEGTRCLATWLIMVFRADSHPGYRHHAGSAPQPGQAGTTPAAARPQISHPRAASMEKVRAGRLPNEDRDAGTGHALPDPLAPSHRAV
jgi:hypothetical protein